MLSPSGTKVKRQVFLTHKKVVLKLCLKPCGESEPIFQVKVTKNLNWGIHVEARQLQTFPIDKFLTSSSACLIPVELADCL